MIIFLSKNNFTALNVKKKMLNIPGFSIFFLHELSNSRFFHVSRLSGNPVDSIEKFYKI